VGGREANAEAGFTLIEVLIATGIFVFVAVAGFETLRQLGAGATQLAQRAAEAANLNTALAQLRSDAASASAVWVPVSTCGPAISMLRRNASGTTFVTYVLRASSLLRAGAPGPIDPRDSTLPLTTVLSSVAGLTVAAVPASALASHADPVSGNVDGGLFGAGVPSVAVSAHASDYDGSAILTGNGIVEVTLDADPAEATVDLVAGNRPSAFTDVLTYACGDRCAANGVFPEIASLDVDSCTLDAPDLPDTNASYVASSTGVSASGQIVTTAYAVRLRYGFTFSGSAAAFTVYREGPTFVWPAAAGLSDSYPVDYTNNAVRATGAAALAALAGTPASLATETGACEGISGESLFHG
jgi:type II secretory pathway pseudopilin PulG